MLTKCVPRKKTTIYMYQLVCWYVVGTSDKHNDDLHETTNVALKGLGVTSADG